MHVLAVLPLSLLDTPDLFFSSSSSAAAQSGLCRLLYTESIQKGAFHRSIAAGTNERRALGGYIYYIHSIYNIPMHQHQGFFFILFYFILFIIIILYV